MPCVSYASQCLFHCCSSFLFAVVFFLSLFLLVVYHFKLLLIFAFHHCPLLRCVRHSVFSVVVVVVVSLSLLHRISLQMHCQLYIFYPKQIRKLVWKYFCSTCRRTLWVAKEMLSRAKQNCKEMKQNYCPQPTRSESLHTEFDMHRMKMHLIATQEELYSFWQLRKSSNGHVEKRFRIHTVKTFSVLPHSDGNWKWTCSPNPLAFDFFFGCVWIPIFLLALIFLVFIVIFVQHSILSSCNLHRNGCYIRRIDPAHLYLECSARIFIRYSSSSSPYFFPLIAASL